MECSGGRCDTRHVGDREARGAFAGALEEAGKNSAGAQFQKEVAMLLIEQSFERLGPADRARDLFFERAANVGGFGNRSGVDVGEHEAMRLLKLRGG